MKFSRVLAALSLTALAVAVVTVGLFLSRSPEPDLAADSVTVGVAPESPTIEQVQTPAPQPAQPGVPQQRAVAPNLVPGDWCDDDDWDDDDWDDDDDRDDDRDDCDEDRDDDLDDVDDRDDDDDDDDDWDDD